MSRRGRSSPHNIRTIKTLDRRLSRRRPSRGSNYAIKQLLPRPCLWSVVQIPSYQTIGTQQSVVSCHQQRERRVRKRVRVEYRWKVCKQECTMEQKSVQCDGCECWIHMNCINITLTQYVNFCRPSLQFFCRQCIGTGDRFNFASSLSRISALSPDLPRMREQPTHDITVPSSVPSCFRQTQIRR